MWQADSSVIQIELGCDVVRLFTSKDSRGFVGKLFGKAPPSEGDLIVSYTKQFREYLQNKENITLPSISYSDSNELKSNEVQVYFGLETDRFTISDGVDIFNFITAKIHDYAALVTAKNHDINASLIEAIEDINAGKLQEALKIYSVIYYYCYSANNSFYMVRCLSDVGNIMLINGEIEKANAFFLKAATLCNNPSIVDPLVKIQVAINVASTLKILSAFDIAHSSYKTAANIAFYSGNKDLLFVALIGLAEIEFVTGDYEQSVFVLEQADSLLFSDEKNPDYKVSRDIQKFISEIKGLIISIISQRLKQVQKQLAEEKAKVLFTDIFKTVGSLVFKLGVEYYSFKRFGEKGAGLALSLITNNTTRNTTITNCGQVQFGNNSNMMSIIGRS